MINFNNQIIQLICQAIFYINKNYKHQQIDRNNFAINNQQSTMMTNHNKMKSNNYHNHFDHNNNRKKNYDNIKININDNRNRNDKLVEEKKNYHEGEQKERSRLSKTNGNGSSRKVIAPLISTVNKLYNHCKEISNRNKENLHKQLQNQKQSQLVKRKLYQQQPQSQFNKQPSYEQFFKPSSQTIEYYYNQQSFPNADDGDGDDNDGDQVAIMVIRLRQQLQQVSKQLEKQRLMNSNNNELILQLISENKLLKKQVQYLTQQWMDSGARSGQLINNGNYNEQIRITKKPIHNKFTNNRQQQAFIEETLQQVQSLKQQLTELRQQNHQLSTSITTSQREQIKDRIIMKLEDEIITLKLIIKEIKENESKADALRKNDRQDGIKDDDDNGDDGGMRKRGLGNKISGYQNMRDRLGFRQGSLGTGKEGNDKAGLGQQVWRQQWCQRPWSEMMMKVGDRNSQQQQFPSYRGQHQHHYITNNNHINNPNNNHKPSQFKFVDFIEQRQQQLEQ